MAGERLLFRVGKVGGPAADNQISRISLDKKLDKNGQKDFLIGILSFLVKSLV
jgi:hypothetical protein